MIARSLAVPIVIIAIWQWAAGNKGAGSFRSVTPTGVGSALIEMGRSGKLESATLVTVERVLLGFAVAIVLAVTVAALLATVRPFQRLADPVLEFLRPMAPVAWVPLAVFWFGATDQAAVFIVAYASFFPIVTNLAAGIRQLDPAFGEAARTLGASPAMTLREVMLPGALPLAIAGARVGFGTAWAAIIAAELAVGVTSGQNSNAGLGQAMYSAFLYDSRLAPILALICVVAAVAFVIDAGIRRLERRLTPWAGR
jgi:ABC-type nitrate/sulfonate/bicarbonate transport system permease component